MEHQQPQRSPEIPAPEPTPAAPSPPTPPNPPPPPDPPDVVARRYWRAEEHYYHAEWWAPEAWHPRDRGTTSL